MPKVSKCEAARARLEQEGWVFDHEALTNKYYPAGSVTEMQTRKGVDYCRVHRGESVGRWDWQRTYVYARRAKA